jgi:hypothetical protein
MIMPDQTKAKMYVAADRSLKESDWFRSYNTFDFSEGKPVHKAPIGPLYGLHDDTLAGGRSFVFFVEEDSAIVLLQQVPLVKINFVLHESSNKNKHLLFTFSILQLPTFCTNFFT